MSDHDQMLGQLGLHPGWAILSEKARGKADAHFAHLARQFAAKDNRPDYDTLQWQRGFFAGMDFLIANPTVEASKLAKALAREQDEVN
jgi:membrane-associated PAP2 superfamily phosphatase